MNTYHCSHCGQTVFFENTRCEGCGHALAFDPATMSLLAWQPGPDGTLQPSTAALAPEAAQALQQRVAGGRLRPCAHHALPHGADAAPAPQGVCNWLSDADDADGGPLCLSCRCTEVLPALDRPGNLEAWSRLETAKRRLLHGLLAAGLPIPRRPVDPQGLAFRFLEELPDAPEPVLTGHDHGLITVSIAEADDATREARRAAMHEPYRTLLGHFRHEIGHFYWDQLIAKDERRLAAFRALFGDERADYGQALERHYREGAPADWPQRHISAYATMHPWEDWAETWAHWMHISDSLDTASHWGVRLQGDPVAGPAVEPDTALAALPGTRDFRRVLVDEWLPLSRFLNSMGRSLGQGDAWPFVVADPVLDRLAFVHQTVREAALSRSTPAG